ncbi:DUF389 domain-containing protein [Albibacterium bauzanense]|uniref:Putative hydrophobic protein (TIGR00271 family) n=2 Tax=Sphingobacteriaceae TaxID=84566 RepID=A0A4R1LRE5_9SPHI|nr:DUF389 domain-containing protein [Albibacterium bauzanense]TCK80884.1 putative hydrophobic protein (TIGR00271 family) [Albibacterium bauzanense]
MNKLLRRFNIRSEQEDYEVIHQVMESGIVFKGTNLWILIFAIFIACVGLNVNSTAVIIGAMLISPLMGPIIGMGYSLATYDFFLLKKAASNFVFAVASGLITSTLYFLVTPINEAHSELLARTQPNIYDVLIALFGGLAGIVAMSSKVKGNIIPGVAIATALMPPLCTAGYGLATANWSFFLGAFYLFTINTVFIGAATLITVRLLKFPMITYTDERQKIKANRWVTFIALMTMIPSIYFGYIMVQQENYNQNATSFINNETFIEGDYLLQSKINAAAKKISLTYGGKAITEVEKEKLKSKLPFYGLEGTDLAIQQGFKINDTELKTSTQDKTLSELNRLRLDLANNQLKLDSIEKNRELGKVLLKEIEAFFPQVIACSVGEQLFFKDSIATPYYLVVLKTDLKPLLNADQVKLKTWLNTRLQADSIEIFIAD